MMLVKDILKVAKAALRTVNFDNKLHKQYIKDWPEGDKAS